MSIQSLLRCLGELAAVSGLVEHNNRPAVVEDDLLSSIVRAVGWLADHCSEIYKIGQELLLGHLS